jgi:hypothetical protein
MPYDYTKTAYAEQGLLPALLMSQCTCAISRQHKGAGGDEDR